MKRVLAAIMAIMMVLSFAGCGAKNTEPVYDGPQLVRNPQIDLGENLPFFVLTGEYMKDEITEAQAAEGLVESYTALSNKVESLCIYNIPANGSSIMDRMSFEEKEFGLETQQLYFAEFDSLIEPNDYHYGYYIALRAGEGDQAPTYVKNYIFLDGDKFVKLEFIVPTYEVSFEELNTKLALPYGMNEQEIPEHLVEEGDTICFFGPDDDNDYPYFSAYAWPTEGHTLSEGIKEFEDNYEVKVVYSYQYTFEDGTTKDCYYLLYNMDYEGEIMQNESILTIVGDNYVELCYSSVAEGDAGFRQQMAVSPFMWSVDKIN